MDTRRLTSHALVVASIAAASTSPLWADSPAPAHLVDLGAQLFADRSLSRDGTVACASCHQPKHAFADPRPVSVGVGGAAGTRNTPSLLGVTNRAVMTWDGRTRSVAEQVLVALTHPHEQGLADHEVLVERVSTNHRAAFQAAFGKPTVTAETIQAALVAYLATLSAGTSAFDRHVAGDSSAMPNAAKRGWELFRGSAGCAQCHRAEGGGATFTDDEFHRIGIGLGGITPQLRPLTARVEQTSPSQREALIASDPAVAALGRFVVTGNPKDIGKYRTPSLRNVALTAPYMHDGSIATLEATVDYEVNYRGQARDRPLGLTEADKADLVAFLQMLTGQPSAVSTTK